MFRPILAPAILGLSLLASCTPVEYDAPPPWGSPPGPYLYQRPGGPPSVQQRRPGGVDALRNDRMQPRDPYSRDDSYSYEREEPRYEPRQPAPPSNPGPTRDSYPVAERTTKPDQVISPYPPYNVIDVEGFRSGQLARDPSNQKIFRVP